MDNKQQLQLNAHLAEHARVVGEIHAIFQRQQQMINVILILGSAATGIIVQKQFEVLHGNLYVWLPLVPLPFLVLTALHLRDDLKINALDEYIWLVLRNRIINITGLAENDVWNFLQVSHRIRFGPPFRFGGFYFLLTVMRYTPPLLIIAGALVLHVYSDLGSKLIWSHWSTWVFLMDIIFTVVTFCGGAYIVRRSSQYINGRHCAWMTKGIGTERSQHIDA